MNNNASLYPLSKAEKSLKNQFSIRNKIRFDNAVRNAERAQKSDQLTFDKRMSERAKLAKNIEKSEYKKWVRENPKELESAKVKEFAKTHEKRLSNNMARMGMQGNAPVNTTYAQEQAAFKDHARREYNNVQKIIKEREIENGHKMKGPMPKKKIGGITKGASNQIGQKFKDVLKKIPKKAGIAGLIGLGAVGVAGGIGAAVAHNKKKKLLSNK